MATTRKLKVYRTAIGFHDAYVAAPSQKAALEAWGSDRNLFARGVAELVTDSALIEAPLANPGKVIKRLRGSAAEQLAALPAAKPARRRERGAPAELRTPRPKAKTAKPPSRHALDAAEAKLSRADIERAEEDRKLRTQEEALARRRREMERRHAQALRDLTDARDRARDAYDRAMRQWES